MKKNQCKEALEIYKNFLNRMTKLSEFLKVAEVLFVRPAPSSCGYDKIICLQWISAAPFCLVLYRYNVVHLLHFLLSLRIIQRAAKSHLTLLRFAPDVCYPAVLIYGQYVPTQTDRRSVTRGFFYLILKSLSASRYSPVSDPLLPWTGDWVTPRQSLMVEF